MLVGGNVKKNLGGVTRVIRSCKSEPKRLKALQEFFRMAFSEQEQAGIRGRVSELQPE